MKRSKKIFVVASVLLTVGVALFYCLVGSREYKKIENDPTQIKHSDSLTHSDGDATPIDMGAKPEASPKDGSVEIIKNFVKSNSKNPDSFEFLEWSEVLSEDGYWKVRCKYKGISSFNAEVTTNAWFYIRNHKVVYTEIISKI